MLDLDVAGLATVTEDESRSSARRTA